MSRRAVALLASAAIATLLAIGIAPATAAHPLGNFTHNTSVAFTVSPERIAVDHVQDLAEVPTYQERAAMDVNGDGSVSAGEADAWAQARCSDAASRIIGTTDSGPVTWVVGRAAVTFPVGQAGLPTTRLVCALDTSAAGSTTFEARISVSEGRVGWHEVVATGDRVALASDVASSSPSRMLTAYPPDSAPLDVTAVTLSWAPDADRAGGSPTPDVVTAEGRPAVDDAPEAPADEVSSTGPFAFDGAASAFTDLVSRQEITFGFALVALAIAVGLGGLHALAPGHGKTLMAASLIGTGGRRRDAVVLGAAVTGAHTAGVVALALALSISSAVAPESAYPWLGLVSALLAIGVGVSLFRQARQGARAHGHDHHDHPHPHPHPHPHAHPHAHPHPHPHPDSHSHGSVALVAPAPDVTAPVLSSSQRPSTRRVVALGVAGGMVPSPSAVVVLLAGFALGRSWFALLLVVAFGLGMAVTLCITGLIVVRAGHLVERFGSGASEPRLVTVARGALPLVAAAAVVAAGVWIAVRSVLAL
jgi:ABC-type nickel/cobalt efflux system permease component RcnA